MLSVLKLAVAIAILNKQSQFWYGGAEATNGDEMGRRAVVQVRAQFFWQARFSLGFRYIR
jgi:hypothetical protein